jgi:predicted nucleic acid-binding protein
VISVDDAIVLRWGVISGEVKRRTKVSPPVIDTLLAATAIEHGLFFVTRNLKDTQQSGAVIFNPWEDDPARFPLT